jgi:hypothetical protein
MDDAGVFQVSATISPWEATMRRFWSVFSLLGLIAALALGAPTSADAANIPGNRFWVGVEDELGTPIASRVTCRILTTGEVGTNATIYTDRGLGTEASNPITANANGVCSWWGVSTTSSYDVVVYHQRGIARLEAVTLTDHRVRVDRMHPYKHLVFAFTGASKGTEVDTGIDLPEGAMPVDIIIEITSKGTVTDGTNAYLNVGLKSSQTGDPLGFCSGCYLATPAGTTGTPGYYRASTTIYLNTGVGQYIGTWTRGSYLQKASAGNPGGKMSVGGGTPGLAIDAFYIIPRLGPTRVTYTVGTATGVDTAKGYIHLFYHEVGNR